MERAFLASSTLCFLAGFAYSMYALGAKVRHPSRWNFAVMLIGFGLQLGFLQMRSAVVGRCPLTNLFEVLVFLSWSVVLLYFVVGSTYRLSLLGTFTAPLVFLIQVVAQLLPSASLPAVRKVSSGFWPELHAAISLVSYGAFALACVAGVMFLVQERHLKRHNLNSFFHDLPPIANLSVAMQRLMLAGFLLLSVGIIAGFFAGYTPVATIVLAVCVWLPYGAILMVRRTHRLGSRRVAWLAVAAFTLALSTLGVLSHFHIGN